MYQEHVKEYNNSEEFLELIIINKQMASYNPSEIKARTINMMYMFTVMRGHLFLQKPT